jgi:hypothetical protein
MDDILMYNPTLEAHI